MRTPRQTVRAHGKTQTLTPQAYALKLEAHAAKHLAAVVALYRGAPPEVQALLMARPAVSTALAWASNQAEARR
jgi:hypothetical protein